MSARNRRYAEQAGSATPSPSPYRSVPPPPASSRWGRPCPATSCRNWGVRLSRVGALLSVPGVLIAAAWRRRSSNDHEPHALRLLTLLAVAPLTTGLVLALISGHVISFQPRYAAFVVPFVAALLARGLTADGPVARAAAWGQLAIMLVSLVGVYADVERRFRPPDPNPDRAPVVARELGEAVR